MCIVRKIMVLWYVFIGKNLPCGKKGNTFEITFPIQIHSNTFKNEYDQYIKRMPLHILLCQRFSYRSLNPLHIQHYSNTTYSVPSTCIPLKGPENHLPPTEFLEICLIFNCNMTSINRRCFRFLIFYSKRKMLNRTFLWFIFQMADHRSTLFQSYMVWTWKGSFITTRLNQVQSLTVSCKTDWILFKGGYYLKAVSIRICQKIAWKQNLNARFMSKMDV